jgi:addiction module HigA family antidote
MKESDILIPLTHPGEHLLEFIEEYGLTQYRLAKELGVQQTRIMEIVKGRRAISANTALRLARFFRTTPQMWINLQKNYELEKARRESGAIIDEEVRPLPARPRKAG